MSPDERKGDEVMPETNQVTESEPSGVRTVQAGELLGRERLLRIEHRGEVYTLRITRNDRLILTK